MSNIFAKKRREFSLLRDMIMPVLFFVAVVALFGWGLRSIERTTDAERRQSAEKAITRATVQCYAIEGQYPPNLEYLEEHYGLSVDRDLYIVQYTPIGGNIMPDILVMDKYFETDGGEVGADAR